MSSRRVRAVFRKELAEYRRTGTIVYATAILPLIFLVQPLVEVFTLPSSASTALHHEHGLLDPPAIRASAPAAPPSHRRR